MEDLFTGSQVDNGTEVVSELSNNDAPVEQDLFNGAEEGAEAVEAVEAQAPEVAKVDEAKQLEEKFASKFAALSRKDKQLRDQERELKARLSDMDKRFAELEQRSAPKEAPKAAELPLEYRLKSNPLKTLEELGIPFNKLTEVALNDGKLPMEMQMELMKRDMDEKHSRELEALRSELIEDKKSREQEKFANTLNGFMQEITNTVNSSEAYELIQANNAVQLVYDVIETHYNDEGKVLDIATAAEHVENYLFEEGKKVFNLKKMQSMLNPTPSKPVETKSQSVSKPTLSNSLASNQTKVAKKLLTEDESKRLAASMIKWED